MKATKKELERALDLCARSLVTAVDKFNNLSPMGTHCSGACPIRSEKRRCCSDDPDCNVMIATHFLALAKQGKKEDK